jgi:hypothetical protein
MKRVQKRPGDEGTRMIRAAFTFFLLAFVMTLIGASDAGGMTTDMGHFFLLVFLVLAIVFFCFGMMPTENFFKDSNENDRSYDYDKSSFQSRV